MSKTKPAASAAKEPKFSKEALLNSERFRHERDVVSALLNCDLEYSIPEVEGMIEEYMKGTVK